MITDRRSAGSLCLFVLGLSLAACGGGSSGGGGYSTPNRAPQLSSTAFATDEDTPLMAALSATDADGDRLSYVVTTNPQNGTLTLGADGAFTYAPRSNFNGSDSFAVTVADSRGGQVSGTLAIT